MNKKTLIILIGVAVVVVILGIVIYVIATQKPSNGSGSTTPVVSKTVIQYWGLWEPESVMQPIIDKYQTQNPSIKIEYAQKSFTQYAETVYTRIEKGATAQAPAPDIIKISNTWLPKYQKYLAPVPSTIYSNSEYSSIFYPTCTQDFTGADGKIYAIPIGIDGLALYYNKALLQAAGYTTPPSDWDSFVEAAKKLTIKDSSGKITQAGVAIGSAKNIKHSADILNLMLLQNGVQPITSDGKATGLVSLKAQTSLDYYTSFVSSYKTWSPDSASDLELFYSGKAAMFFGPSWRAFDVIQSNPKIEFGIAPVPQIANNASINYSMYWGEAVSLKSPNQAEAWKFVKFLSQPEQLRDLYNNASKIRAFGQIYPRKDMASEISSNPYVKAFTDMAPTMKSWKMGDQSFVEDSERTAITDVAEFGKKSDIALSDAQTRITTKLAEFYK